MGLLTSIFLICCFDCFFLLSSAHFHKKYHVTSAEQKGSLETRMCVLYTLKSQRSTWITFGRGYYQEYSNLKKQNKTKKISPNTHTPIKTKYGNYDRNVCVIYSKKSEVYMDYIWKRILLRIF